MFDRVIGDALKFSQTMTDKQTYETKSVFGLLRKRTMLISLRPRAVA